MDTPQEDTLRPALEFQAIIPLPFKLLFLIVLGIYLWWLLVKINVDLFGINIAQLINFSYLAHDYVNLDDLSPGDDFSKYECTVVPDIRENKALADGIYRQLKSTSSIIGVFFACYHVFNFGRSNFLLFGSLANLIPFLGMCYVIYDLLDFPSEIIGSSSLKDTPSGSIRFASTLKRILGGDINSQTMRTNDILISDSLVSYNRVINDAVLYLWILICGIDTPYNLLLEFFICLIPVSIRIKQCWLEYNLSGKSNKKHLLNLIKYCTNIPPLFIHMLSRNAKEQNLPTDGLSRIWYFFSFINSTYLFIWDVQCDWGLDWFNLRPQQKLISAPIKYYIAIGLDFVLRFIWVLRYFNYNSDLYLTMAALVLFGGTSHQFGYAMIETLEIIRRWMWCFMKLENDWVNVN